MTEIEIKLQVPASARAALAHELKARSPENLRRQRLQAVYFDTASRLLAAESMALRLRREGRNWVQTLKAGKGNDSLSREEDNIRLPDRSAAEPALDLNRHLRSPAGRRLQLLLQRAQGESLQRRFATDVRRQSQIQRTRRGFVELSLDEGLIQSEDRQMTLRELEIEAIKGSPLAVLEAAAGYVKRYQVWIDLRTKAQRGHMLAEGRLFASPAKAGAIELLHDANLDEALLAIFSDCRRQVMQNASQIAAEEGHGPEHVHQIRVGLRRLRTAFKLFGERLHAISHWDAQARTLAGELGASRDRDVLAETLWPRLRDIEAPLIEIPLPTGLQTPRELIRDKQCQLWFLEWLEHDLKLELDRHTRPGSPETWSAVSAQTVLLEVLQRWYRKCKKMSAHFSQLSVDERHDLRKRMKRLRYGVEFLRSLLQEKRLEQFLQVMAAAQDALGEYNDLHVAHALYKEYSASNPQAWFAVGWLAAQSDYAAERCIKVLDTFSKTPAPWRKRDLPQPLCAAAQDASDS
ncbi:MAG: CHAD domain-containing protein [Betaproteobacteria bacterium]|nr:CHAD domain-containing protein [Betaproteobacteria bacterium]